MTHPALSVFLCNYNHGPYLRQSIESVLCQTYRDFQLIIVDDGSTDDSWQTIREYTASDNRIIAQRFAQNRGVAEAVACAIESCTGEFIFGRAADDYLISPVFFQHFADAIKTYPSAAGVFGGSEIIDAGTGIRYATMGFRKSMEEAGRLFSYISPEQARAEFLQWQLFIPGASAIWRRDLIDAAGGFDDHYLGPQSDYFLNHALPMQHGVVEIHEIVAAVRGAQTSYSSGAEEELFFTRHARVEKKMRALIPDAAEEKAWLHWRDCVINTRFSALENTSTLALAKLDSVLGQIKSMPQPSRERLSRSLKKLREKIVQEYDYLFDRREQRKRQVQHLFEKIVRSKDKKGIR